VPFTASDLKGANQILEPGRLVRRGAAGLGARSIAGLGRAGS
jgi:hypothetical protein